MKLSIKFLAVFISLLSLNSYGQIKQFNFKRELNGIDQQWHRIELPVEVFNHVSPGLNDLRIIGITKNNDSIEVPFYLNNKRDKIIEHEMPFNIINSSSNGNGYYVTLEIPQVGDINQIKLNFDTKNFDWLLQLEGSQDQLNWFSIVDDYRILSINNKETAYEFTNIAFPTSRYKFFRILIKNSADPQFISAQVSFDQVEKGDFRTYKIASTDSFEKRDTNVSEFEIQMTHQVPASSVAISVNNNYDYYRPIVIEYLSDSLKTEKGWKYRYSELTRGTISSFENNRFDFRSTLLKKLRIKIYHQDNEPLKVTSFEVGGFPYEMIARFDEPATYYLFYGSENSKKPSYDLQYFKSKTPEEIPSLSLGAEEKIEQKKSTPKEPFIKNKLWLWLVMIIIIAILGWFTFKMIKTD